MTPINGFFEYGIFALFGAVGMTGLSIWALLTDDARKDSERSLGTDPETKVFSHLPYNKKVA